MKPTYKGKELLPLSVIDAARDGDSQAVDQVLRYYEGYINKLCTRTLYDSDGQSHVRVYEYMKRRLEIKLIYIQVKKGDVDLNTDDYSSLNGEVYLLTTEGKVQNEQKYANVKVAKPTVIYEFAINPDKSHIIPENVLYWVKFLTEIENNRLKFSACKGIMFDTNISYSDTNESEMILGNKIAAYGDAKRYIDSFRKDDYALFYSKGRGIIAVGQIVTDTPTEVGNEKYHSVRMIVPENFNGDVKALPALSPNEIKTILKRNFYWASTIKTPFLTGVQVEMLIRELKKKHI